MKKFLSLLSALSLCLSLAACGGKTVSPFDPETDAKTLLETPGVFGEALTEIEQSTACALYGIDEDTVTSGAVYAALSSAEELAIFTFSDKDSAQAAATLLGYRVEDRRDELENYLPLELPKLDKAVIEVRENSVLLIIAADYGPVDDFLGG